MVLLGRKSVLFAKVEGTQGVDASPVASTDAIIVFDFDNGNEVDINERDDQGVALGNQQEVGGKARMNMTFMTEMRGSGVAGTVPQGDSALWKACGFKETVAGGSSVTYDPRSASFESATIYANIDGVLSAVLGAIGNVEISLVSGETAKLNWTMNAPWVIPTDVAVPTTHTVNTTLPPVAKNMTVLLDSFSPIIRSIKFNPNNVVTERDDLQSTYGIAGFQITNRNFDGEIVIEAVTVAAKNFWSLLDAGTLMALSVIIGTTAGNIITITASTVRIRNITWTENEGIALFTIPFQCVKSGDGNNELSVVYT